jgi:Na+/proline symporter
LLPDFNDWGTALTVFIMPIAVQWWSVWYPGAEPGGGSYIAQRMLAARSEKDAVNGTLLFNVMHYAVRPWPWIITALCSTLVYPQLSDIARAFPYVDAGLIGHDTAYPAMMRFLPAGFLGLVIAGTLAAYRSTIETHLNWGTSYLVHDLYRRFLNPKREERHYVFAGRLTTAALMVCAALMTYGLSTAKEAFDLILSIGAGTGLIYLLRWFWWRVNAWCEIAAMVSSFVIAIGFYLLGRAGHPVPSHVVLLSSVALTTVVWVTTAFLTQPTDRATLLSFYRLVRPAGPGWTAIRAEAGVPASPDSLPQAMLGWVLGIGFVYSALFGTGSFLYGRTSLGVAWLVVFLVTGVGLLRVVPRLWEKSTA